MASDTFRYTASGPAGNTASATLTVTVTGLNDAPVLDVSKSPTLSTETEDAGTPVGAVGTLVSALVGIGNVKDADTGALGGIAVTGADTTNGHWFYSTDNGQTWKALGSVGDDSARLLAADTETRIYFRPDDDWNGTLGSALTFHAWDQTSGANGGTANLSASGATGGSTAFSTGADTAALMVSAVNDAPVNSVQLILLPTRSGAVDGVDNNSGECREARQIVTIAWPSPQEQGRREIVLPAGADEASLRLMRSDTHKTLLTAVAKARAWMQDLTGGKVADTNEIAAREGKNERYVRMVLPLAFLAPDIVEIAASHQLPEGWSVSKFVADLPASWSRQRPALELPTVS